MTEERVQIDRRNLLSTTAGVGSGAAGCLGQERQPGRGDYSPESEPSQQESPVEQPSSTGRIGDAVFYDPANPGPYTDGQDALEDVPLGGTLIIGNGTWDVATEGRIVTDKKIAIRGQGWWANYSKDVNLRYGGTLIENTGEDVVDEPSIEFHPREDDKRGIGRIRDLSVRHESQAAPAVRFRDTIRTLISDCSIRGLGSAPECVTYDGMSFFARAQRNHIVGATDICVHVSGSGYAHEFYSNHIATGNEGATAFQTERQRTILMGGECISANGMAIRFHNPGTDGIQTGGYVVEPGIEHDPPHVYVGGEAPFNDVQFYHTKLPLGQEAPAVTFDGTNNSKLIYPVVKFNQRGDLVKWTANSQNCGVLTEGKTISNGVTFSDEGATNPYVSVSGTTTPEMLEAVPETVPMSFEFHPDSGGPVYFDGEEWTRPPAESFTPGMR
jgi:hypothetical protein